MTRDEVLNLMAGMERVVSGATLSTVRLIIELLRTHRFSRDNFTFEADKTLDDAVNALLIQLSDAIILETEKRIKSFCEDEDTGAVLAFVRQGTNGQTLTERMDQHCSNLKVALAAFITAMIADNVSLGEMPGRFMAWINTNAMHFGRGMASNPITGMSHLASDTINRGSIRRSLREAERGGAVGYMVYRGSNFPCAECDSVCFGPNGKRRLYSFDEECPIPVHPNCVCHIVEVMAEDMIG